MTPEQNRQLNFLCGCPEWGNTTMTTEDFRTILLETGGNVMACGYLWDIVGNHLGAGVYKVTLKPFNHKGRARKRQRGT